MKKLLLLLSITVLLANCEKPIGVDLHEGAPKLVVDAEINWEKGTAGNEQKIKLTTTSSYFSSTVPIVS